MNRQNELSVDVGAFLLIVGFTGFLFFRMWIWYLILFIGILFVLAFVFQNRLAEYRDNLARHKEESDKIGAKTQDCLQKLNKIEIKRANEQTAWIEIEKQRKIDDARLYYESVDIKPGTYIKYDFQAKKKKIQYVDLKNLLERVEKLYEWEHSQKEKEIEIQATIKKIRDVEAERIDIKNAWITAECQVKNKNHDAHVYYNSVGIVPGEYATYNPVLGKKEDQLAESKHLLKKLQGLQEQEKDLFHTFWERECDVPIRNTIQLIHDIERRRTKLQNAWIALERQSKSLYSESRAYYSRVDIPPGKYDNYDPYARNSDDPLAETQQILHRLEKLYDWEFSQVKRANEKNTLESKRTITSEAHPIKKKEPGLKTDSGYRDAQYDYNYLKDLYDL
jgi:hypothetical protein